MHVECDIARVETVITENDAIEITVANTTGEITNQAVDIETNVVSKDRNGTNRSGGCRE